MKTNNIPRSCNDDHPKKARILIFMLVISCFTAQVVLSSTDITVRPYEIKFDYESGSTNDAITLRDSYGTLITKPEWKYSPSRSNDIAYIKNQTNRKVKVKFDSNCDDMQLIINLTVTSGTGIGTLCNHVIMNYEDMQEVTLTLDGSIPSTVDERQFTWKWEVYGITSESGYCSATSTNYTTHTYYTLLSTPQAPMAEPWSSVLEYACDWASGQSTESNVLSSLTNELYDCGVEYHGGEHYTKSSFTNLDLTDLLDDLSNPSTVQMDCRDFSNFLHVLSNAVGMDGEYYRIYHTDTSYPNFPYIFQAFLYNYLYPAGWPAPDDGDYWNYHQVGWFDSKVADPAAKIDNDVNPTTSPHTWKLVVGDLTIAQYNDKLTEELMKSGGTGICTVY